MVFFGEETFTFLNLFIANLGGGKYVSVGRPFLHFSFEFFFKNIASFDESLRIENETAFRALWAYQR